MLNNDPEKLWHEMSQEERNKIVGSAIDAWMDKQFARFGRRTFGSVMAAAFGYLIYFLFMHHAIGK